MDNAISSREESQSEKGGGGGDDRHTKHSVHRQKGEIRYLPLLGRWTFSLARLDLNAELVLQSARAGEGGRERRRERKRREMRSGRCLGESRHGNGGREWVKRAIKWFVRLAYRDNLFAAIRRGNDLAALFPPYTHVSQDLEGLKYVYALAQIYQANGTGLDGGARVGKMYGDRVQRLEKILRRGGLFPRVFDWGPQSGNFSLSLSRGNREASVISDLTTTSRFYSYFFKPWFIRERWTRASYVFTYECVP